MVLGKGERVITPGGEGKVITRRMKLPRKVEVEVYCVKLDCQSAIPSYTGTIYRAKDVRPINEE